MKHIFLILLCFFISVSYSVYAKDKNKDKSRDHQVWHKLDCPPNASNPYPLLKCVCNKGYAVTSKGCVSTKCGPGTLWYDNGCVPCSKLNLMNKDGICVQKPVGSKTEALCKMEGGKTECKTQQGCEMFKNYGPCTVVP